MNRPSRSVLAVFVLPAIALSLMLSGCVPSPAADDATQPAAESATPQSDPSPSSSPTEELAEESEGGEPSTSPAPSKSPEATPSKSPSATPTSSPSPAGPVVNVISQRCVSSRLTVTMTANYNNGYRKGINSIVVERPNEYNAMIDEDASWLGPETGQGNQWTVQPAGSKQQRFKDTLRITAKAAGGSKTIINVDITANC